MSVKESPAVKNWLSRISVSSHRARLAEFKSFMNWVRVNGDKFATMTPDDLLNYQRATNNGSQFEILDLIQKYILSSKGQRLNTKKTKLSIIKSFFLHNRAQLPQDPSFNLRGDKPRVQGILSPEEIKKVVLSSSAMYQSVFLAMLGGGMDQESFIYWSDNGWGKLKKDLSGDPEYIKVELPGRKKLKNEAPFYTLLGGDALDALKRWVKVRPKEASTIYVDQFKEPLTKAGIYSYWCRHLRKVGVIPSEKGSITSRYGRNPHELRDVFRTLWSKSGAAAPVGEFLMGHSQPGDEYGYDKSYLDETYVLQQYRRALSYLNVMSGTKAYGQVSEDRVVELESELERLKRQLEEAKRGQNGKVEELEKRFDRLDRFVKKWVKDRLTQEELEEMGGEEKPG